MTVQPSLIKPSAESYQADPTNPFKLDLLRLFDRARGLSASPSRIVLSGELVSADVAKIGAAPSPGGVAPGSAIPKQAPGPVAVAVVSAAPGPAVVPSLEDQAIGEWKASSDLQSAFPAVGAYVAFRKAAAAGRVRGYDATWQPSDGLIQKARVRPAR